MAIVLFPGNTQGEAGISVLRHGIHGIGGGKKRSRSNGKGAGFCGPAPLLLICGTADGDYRMRLVTTSSISLAVRMLLELAL